MPHVLQGLVGGRLLVHVRGRPEVRGLQLTALEPQELLRALVVDELALRELLKERFELAADGGEERPMRVR